MDINCEGYKIAYSAHDEQCDGCKASAKCEEATKFKLNNRGGTTMAKKLTEKQLKALLAKTKTAKALVTIVKDNKYTAKLVKGMSIQDAKDAIMLAAFPPAEDPDDDFDDADDFGDDKTDEKDVKPDDDGDDDFNDADADADADEGAADIESKENTTEDDPEDIDSLEARVTALEKRLDEVLATLQKAPAGKAKTGKAEKDAIKAKLVEACPYKAADLKKLNGREIKMLASAVGVNSFRQARPDTEKEILKAKLNKKPAK